MLTFNPEMYLYVMFFPDNFACVTHFLLV